MSDDLVKKALELLKNAPDVPPDPGDEMPDEGVIEMRRWAEWFIAFTKSYQPEQRAWIAHWMNRKLVQAMQMVIDVGGNVERLPQLTIGLPKPGEIDHFQWPPVPAGDRGEHDQATPEGLMRARSEGSRYALILAKEEQIAELARKHFGDGAVATLLLDGNLHIVAPSAEAAGRETQIAFMGDVSACVGVAVPFPVIHAQGAPTNDLETKARSRGRILKGVAS